MSIISYHAGFFNTIYNAISIKLSFIVYDLIIKYLDRGFFEYVGPYGIYVLSYYLYRFNRVS